MARPGRDDVEASVELFKSAQHAIMGCVNALATIHKVSRAEAFCVLTSQAAIGIAALGPNSAPELLSWMERLALKTRSQNPKVIEVVDDATQDEWERLTRAWAAEARPRLDG